MNARTIQHPGVEIREIDMSEYTDSITINNAYIIGFADRGPIYDYSWITTRSEFLKLYGQPQTEAEKYLYYAAMSILNNGGTPIISRMPYDNKQCKAYKGLAIRYAGVTQNSDDPDEVTVYGWSNSPSKEGDYFPDFNDGTKGVPNVKGTNAIPLSASILVPLTGVANLLGENDSLEQTLYKLQHNLTSGEVGLPVSSCTVMNLLYALNPVNEQDLYNYLIKVPSISGVVKDYIEKSQDAELSANLKNATSALSALKNNVELSTLLEWDGKDQRKLSASNLSNNIDQAETSLEALTGYSISSYNALLASSIALSTNTEVIGYFNEPISLSKITTPSSLPEKIVRWDTNVSSAWIALNFNSVKSASIYELSSDVVPSALWESTEFFGNTPTTDAEIQNRYVMNGKKVIGLSGTLQKNLVNPNYPLSTAYNKIIKQYVSVANQCENIIEDLRSDSLYEEVAIDGLKYYGVEPSVIGISPSAVLNLMDICSGVISSDIMALTGGLKDYEKVLQIYNSPKFWNLNASVDSEDHVAAINQAIIDAKLLTQKSVGYDYGIYLDSKEVQISNEQYDDLVTSQKFGNGQDLRDTDATNDPDFKYRSDIRSANFIIVDKHKTIATGEGSNEGYFVTIIDPYDALKAQRLLGIYATQSELNNNSSADPNTEIEYWIEQNKVDWKQAVVNQINTVNLIQHVYNADNILIGETVTGKRHKNLMDSWSVSLTGDYYDQSISKNLGNLFMPIPIADIKPGQKTGASAIDKVYSSHICVAVCKTMVDPANGKITVAAIENFFGSLFDEKDPQSGRKLYIGDIINSSSNYIEFYRNDFVKNPYGDDPLQIRIPQVYLKNSAELKAAADNAAIDLTLYDCNDSIDVFIPEEYITTGTSGQTFIFDEFCELYDVAETEGSKLHFAHKAFESFVKLLAQIVGTFNWPKNGTQMLNRANEFKQVYIDYFMNADADNYRNPALEILPCDFTDNLQLYSYSKLIKDLNYKANIFIFDKTNTVLYNNHPVCYFTSFSRKESQKIIANTTGLPGPNQGSNMNVAKNFVKDMDRCIKFIKNVDEVSIFFVVDAGLSSIAQFCDDIVWDYFKKQKAFEPVTGGWITQGYDPDHDQDASDREITSIEDVNTWRTVVTKLDEISREIRRDCMTIIDAPRQLTLDGAAPKIRRSRPTNDWETQIGDKLQFIGGLNSSYTAGYYNWLRMTDTFSGKAFWLPPTCKVIGNYMYLNIMNLPWLAPAGFNYGVITGIHGLSHNPGYKEEDQIYLKSWNYIKQYPFEGFVIEGQKTTLTKNSAFNRINVRTLFLDLERFVYNVSKTYKYQVNNQYTREQYVQSITPKFSDYQSRGGIYEFKIICDETNNTWETIDANELRASIYIKPARLIEYILVDFICTKSGANFDELT